MKNTDIAVIILLALAVGLCIGIVAGSNLERAKMKREAIEAGYAKYVCNEKTGKTIFIYINNTNSLGK